jgi:hypothetical protein
MGEAVVKALLQVNAVIKIAAQGLYTAIKTCIRLTLLAFL